MITDRLFSAFFCQMYRESRRLNIAAFPLFIAVRTH